ncbi:MAG: hypothetical protein AAF411_27445 [Myxococcota bacterium]
MPYLYGDSEPFPLDYNFLETLASFVENGAKAAHHDAAITRTERALAQGLSDLETAQRNLKAFADTICQGLSDTRALAPADPPVVALGDDVLSYAEAAASRAVAAQGQRADKMRAQAEAEIAEHRRVMREALEGFLLRGVLGGELVHATLTLEGKGGYAIAATRRLIGGVEVTYRIDTERFAEWTQPRTVESVAGAMELQVGMKKKFLRRDLTRELMRVGDHTIMAALMDESGAEITIKKKVDSNKPPLTLMLAREDDQLDAYIERADKDVFPAVPSDAEKISGLWHALESVGRRALDHRDAVVSVRYHDEDLLNGAGIHALVGVLLEAYAPIAKEIDRRSASSRELSLKLEHPSGSREELYLDKAQLRRFVEERDPAVLERFRQLPLVDRGSRVPPPLKR